MEEVVRFFDKGILHFLEITQVSLYNFNQCDHQPTIWSFTTKYYNSSQWAFHFSMYNNAQ